MSAYQLSPATLDIFKNFAQINGKIRLLAQLGAALLAAKISGGDIGAAVEAAIGWNDLGREVDEARKLIRPDSVDPVAVAATNYPVLRQVGPSFIASFTFGAVPACHALARAVAIMRTNSNGSSWPRAPSGVPSTGTNILMGTLSGCGFKLESSRSSR